MDTKLQYEKNRIFAQNETGELIAEITFPALAEDVVDINHTFVHESLRGQGMADQLMRAAVQTIQSNQHKAVATCPYAVSWAAKNPETKDVFIDRQSC